MAEADPRESGDRVAQGPAEQPVLDRVAERCDALLLRRQDRRAEAAALGHVDAPDRRRLRCDRRPGADPLEYAPAAARERRRARIEARLLVGPRRDRLDHDDVERQLRERRGEREADHAAAGDGDVAAQRASAAHAAAIRRSISSGSVGMAAVRTSGLPAVTTTSSSMRTPMPHHSRRTSLLPGGM